MIRFFAKHPTAANLLMFGIIIMGILNLKGLRRETFPDFLPREVEILVPYPGATSEDVEEAVCQRVEDALDGVRYIEEVRCDARDGAGIITVEMVDGGDWSAFKDEIDTAMAAIDNFPDKVEEYTVKELHTTDPVFSLLVSGDMPVGDLKLYAEGLKDRLQNLPEVEMVNVEGFSEHQLRVELNSQALLDYGLSPSDVASRIQKQNIDLPAGTVETDREEILVRFNEERSTVTELENLVVLSTAAGSDVPLKRLGTIVDDFKRDEDKVTVDGKRAALLAVRKTDEQDIIRVGDAVKAFLNEERLRNPAVEIMLVEDISKLVVDRLTMLIRNGWQGMILVFAVMWLFFNVKLSLWVVASLPVSFLGAFLLVPEIGLTINMMTMVGLLLGIGILMDDGIVIAENIAAHYERGKPIMTAAIDGVSEVFSGVLSSFLTTCCTLGPLMFLSGNIGRVLEVVAMILLIVLAVSLIEAFLILPSHLAHSLKRRNQSGRIRRAIDNAFNWVKVNVLGQLVDRLIAWRYLWLGCVAAAFIVSLALPASGIMQFQALPELDGDTATARILMPQGTPLKETEAVVQKLTDALERVNQRLTPSQPGGKELVQVVYVKYNQNADAFESGPHVATVYAELLSAESRSVRLDDVFARWREEVGPIADALAVSFTEGGPSPAGRNIEIRVQGHDLDEMQTVNAKLKQWLNRYPGVSNLTSDLRPGKREYQVRFRPGTLGLELDANLMAQQLRAAFQGQQANEIQVGSESYEIEVRFDDASQDAISDLKSFRFTLPTGEQIPLSGVATIEEGRGWSRIARVDNIRTATLRGDVDGRKTNTQALLTELQKEYLPVLREEHPSIKYELEGEAAESGKTMSSMLRGLAIGVIGIFILLSFQFRSYIEPLIVMAVIPCAFIGVIWGHVIMGYDLTMPSVLGFISLAGIVVNDSILLVLFLKAARAKGDAPTQAAGQASRDRFRAILITSATTMAGLLPLMFETSFQAQILIPLALSIVFGLFASTALVLLVIPCLYVVLNDMGLTARLDEAEINHGPAISEAVE